MVLLLTMIIRHSTRLAALRLCMAEVEGLMSDSVNMFSYALDVMIYFLCLRSLHL